MTPYKTAYDTMACQGFVMRKTVEALQEGYIKGWLGHVPGANSQIVQVTGAQLSDTAIPAFAHPILFDDSHKHPVLAVDVRAFGRINPQTQDFVVRNEAEYKLAIARAKLNWLWLSTPGLLRDVSPLPLQIFASAISESVSRRYALNPGEQMKLALLAGVFYQSLFQVPGEIDEDAKVRLAQSLSRQLRVRGDEVLTMVDQHIPNWIYSVASFCTLAPVVTGSVRLEELSVGVLYSIMGGSWYGTNAKETLAVALEHPPTWLAIVLAALQERTFKNSGIARITERSSYRESARSFQAAVVNLLVAHIPAADLGAPGEATMAHR